MPGCQNVLTHNDPTSLHIYTDYGRFYSVNNLHYPGVGTVLNATDTAQQQEFWQQWRSHPENAAHSDRAKDRGKLFHAIVESHYKVPNYRMDSQDNESAIAEVQPFWQSIQNILPRITDIKLIESAVWHEVDMVCNFDGRPVILDWKTATKPKKPEWCDRYPLQLSAYCACVNRMYDTKIKHGVIVVALPLPNTEAQVLQFPLAEYWPLWLERLVAYWKQQSTRLAEQALRAIQEEYKSR